MMSSDDKINRLLASTAQNPPEISEVLTKAKRKVICFVYMFLVADQGAEKEKETEGKEAEWTVLLTSSFRSHAMKMLGHDHSDLFLFIRSVIIQAYLAGEIG